MNDGVETHLMVSGEGIARKLAVGDAVGEVQSVTASRTPTVLDGFPMHQYTDPTPRRPRP